MKETSARQRLVYVDFIKLFASMLVVISHCILKFVDAGTFTPIFNFIWLTQMPLFMFSAGLTSPSFDKVNTIKSYLRRQIRYIFTLLFPCLTFLIISCILLNTNIVAGFLNFYKNPETNLWFLWILFLFHFVFETGLLLFSKSKIKKMFFAPYIFPSFVWVILFLMAFVFRAVNPTTLSIKLFIFYLIFFGAGFAVGHSNTFVSKIKQNKLLLHIIFIVSVFIFIFIVFFFDSIYSFDDSNIMYLTIRIIGSFSSIFTFFYIFYVSSKNKIFANISQLGRFSLQSYYLHIIFLRFFAFHEDTISMQWLMVVRVSIGLFIFVFLTLFIFYHIPFVHLIIFGKSFSKYSFEKKLPWFLK